MPNMDDLEYWQTVGQWELYHASLVKDLQKESDIQLNPEKTVDKLTFWCYNSYIINNKERLLKNETW